MPDASTSTDALRTAIAQARAAAMRPQPRLRPSEWAEGRIEVGHGSRRGPLVLDPFQRGLLDVIVEPDVSEIVLMKGSQIGWTLIMALAEAYYLEAEPREILNYSETEQKLKAYYNNYLMKLIRGTGWLSDAVPGRQEWTDFRSIGGGDMKLLTAVSPDAFRSYNAGRIFADEVDSASWNDGGDAVSQGDKVGLLKDRGKEYDDGWVYMGSTPTLKDHSRVARRYELGDQRRFFVACPHCGGEQFLEWGGRETQHGVKWPEDDPGAAFYVCRESGCVIEHSEKRAMLERGEWRPTNPDAAPGHVSFHLSSLYSMQKKASWGALAQRFVHASHLAKTGDFGELQAFVNGSLGETWDPTRSDAKRAARLSDLSENLVLFEAEVPGWVRFLTAGVDTQSRDDGRFEVSVIGWGPGQRAAVIGHWILDEHPLEDPSAWHALEEFLRRRFRLADGRAMQIVAACVDSGGHHAQQVVEFCGRHAARRWFAIRGYANRGAKRRPPLWPRDPSKSRHGGSLYEIDTYLAKDALWDRLPRVPRAPGSIVYPMTPLEGAVDHDDFYFQRLTRERPALLKGGGGLTTWAGKYPDNEPWDCLVYAYAATHALRAMKGGAQFSALLEEPKEIPSADEQSVATEPTAPALTQPVARRWGEASAPPAPAVAAATARPRIVRSAWASAR